MLSRTYGSLCRGCPSHWKTIQVFPLNQVEIEALLQEPVVFFRVQQVNLQHGRNDWSHLLGWLEHKEGYKHKTKPVGLILSSGETQGAITPEQRQRRYRDSWYLCKPKSAPSNTKKDVVSKNVPLLADNAKGKMLFLPVLLIMELKCFLPLWEDFGRRANPLKKKCHPLHFCWCQGGLGCNGSHLAALHT